MRRPNFTPRESELATNVLGALDSHVLTLEDLMTKLGVKDPDLEVEYINIISRLQEGAGTRIKSASGEIEGKPIRALYRGDQEADLVKKGVLGDYVKSDLRKVAEEIGIDVYGGNKNLIEMIRKGLEMR